MIARAFLLFASLVLGLLIAEGGLTWFYLERATWGPLERVPEWNSPYLFRVRENQGANALGIRRTDPISEESPVDQFRVLSYGDSISDGYRLEPTESYAAVLERRLRSTGAPRAEILNMLRGHSPTIHSFHLRTDVPRLDPDAVILEIELANDISDEALVSTLGSDVYGLPLRLTRARYLVGWDGYLLAPLALRGSFLETTKVYAKLSRFFGRLHTRLAPNPAFGPGARAFYYSSTADRARLTQSALDAGFERLFESIKGIDRYLAQHEVRFVLLILPARYAFETSPYREAARANVLRAERRAFSLGISIVSAMGPLEERGGAELYMDFCHPTAAGHRAIAAQLEPIVRGWRAESR